VALSNLGYVLEALGAVAKSIDLRPDYLAYSRMGGLSIKLGRYQEAEEAFSESINLKPDYGVGWSGKAWILYELGRYQEALGASEEAIKLSPDHVPAWYYKGLTLNRLGQHDEAVQWLCRAWREREQLPGAAQVADLLRQ
jgi:tetratricopeptide (TPR) repeat protein